MSAQNSLPSKRIFCPADICTKTASLKLGDAKNIIASIPKIPFYVKDHVAKALLLLMISERVQIIQ